MNSSLNKDQKEILIRKGFYIAPYHQKALDIKSNLERKNVSYVVRKALDIYLENILNKLRNKEPLNYIVKEFIGKEKCKELKQKSFLITKLEHQALIIKMAFNYNTDISMHLRKALDLYLDDILKNLYLENTQSLDFALGMIKIDDLEPSKEYIKLVEQEKKEEMTNTDILKILDNKYKKVGISN